MRLPRLLGFAKPPLSAIPLIDDYRRQEWPGPEAAPTAATPPDWQDDLESLFDVVDSRITERRAAVALPVEAPVERVTSPPPNDLWVGFGLEDHVAPAAAAHRAAIELEAIRSIVREAVDEALRDRLAAEVRAGIEAALRQSAPEQVVEYRERPMRPSAVLSIRVR